MFFFNFLLGLANASSQVLSPTRVAIDQLSVKAQTSAGILSKTTSTAMQKRVAHTPTLKVMSPYNSPITVFLHAPNKHSLFCSSQSSAMKRPVIPAEFGAKVPTNVRQRYLNIFIDECLKLCSSEQEAFQMVWHPMSIIPFQLMSTPLYMIDVYIVDVFFAPRLWMKRRWCMTGAAVRTSIWM